MPIGPCSSQQAACDPYEFAFASINRRVVTANLGALSKEEILSHLQQSTPAGTTSRQQLSFDRLLCIEKPEPFVFEAYRFILKREAHPLEVEAHVNRLKRGVRRQRVLLDFMSSPEAQRLGTACPFVWTEERLQQLLALPRSEFLPAVYRSFLWRHIDPGGQEYWSARMNEGIPAAYILYAVASSPEAKNMGARLPASWLPKSPEKLLVLPEGDFLTCSFRAYLWRDPDPNELHPLKTGPRMWVLFQLFTAASALGIASQFPEGWLPKTGEGLRLLTTAGQDFLTAIFHHYLWRDPTQDELTRFSDLHSAGTPPGVIFNELAHSGEAKSLRLKQTWLPKSFDELVGLRDEEFLEAAYRNLLWRAPDADGLKTWESLLRNGVPRTFVLYQMAYSLEGRQFCGSFPEHWTPKSAGMLLTLPAADFLAAAYRSILWREPDRESMRYADEFNLGRSRISIIREIATSNEALRIPHKIAGIDHIRDSRFQIRFRVRKKLFNFFRRASRKLLGLDRDSETLRIAAEQTLSELQKDIGRIEQEVRGQQLSDDSFRREFERFRKTSAQLQERVNLELHGQSEAIDGLSKTMSRLRQITDDVSRQNNHADLHLSEIVRTSALVLSKVDKNTSLVSSKLDANTMAVVSQNVESHGQLSQKLDDSVALLAANLSGLRRSLPIPLPDNLLLSKVGNFYYFLPAEDAQLVACLVIGGHLEPGMVEFLERWVQPGMTVVDVGANIGLHSLACARRVGQGGRVYCFEPSPRLAKILEMNLVMNQLKLQSRIEQVAVTDTTGKASFYLTEICGHSSLYQNGTAAQAIDVCTGPLDSLLPHDATIDFVKIDAEGAEPVIIHGMAQIIERNPAISIALEFAPPLLERANYSPANFIEELVGMDFSVMRIDDATGELAAVEYPTLLATASSNLLLRKGGERMRLA